MSSGLLSGEYLNNNPPHWVVNGVSHSIFRTAGRPAAHKRLPGWGSAWMGAAHRLKGNTNASQRPEAGLTTRRPPAVAGRIGT